MHQERNLFAEAFSSLFALRWLVLAYLLVNCIITIFDTWIEDSSYILYLYAPIGSVFYYFMFRRLLKAANPPRDLRQFFVFLIWYIFLLFLFTLGGADLVSKLFQAAPVAMQDQISFGVGFFLCTLVLLFVPTYLLGTLLPAKILKKSDSVRAALQRALRQAGYLLPRYVGIYVPFSLVSATLYVALQLGEPELQPVTPTGEVHAFSFVVMVISGIISIVAEAVLIVMIARAYLQDLRELGDTSQLDVEVFA